MPSDKRFLDSDETRTWAKGRVFLTVYEPTPCFHLKRLAFACSHCLCLSEAVAILMPLLGQCIQDTG
jgi:hypothetical protein